MYYHTNALESSHIYKVFNFGLLLKIAADLKPEKTCESDLLERQCVINSFNEFQFS